MSFLVEKSSLFLCRKEKEVKRKNEHNFKNY